MSFENLEFAAAALKYLAVPAAAIEFLKQERREKIETWLTETLPKLVRTLSITLAFLFLTVVLLVGLGPWLVLIYAVFGKLVHYIFMLALDEDDYEGCLMIGCLLSVLSVVAAVLEKWLIPESWILSIALPYETFSGWANQHWLIDWLLPDFTGEGFLAYYREILNMAENWLWDWLAWFYQLYFFFARGLMLILVVGVQLAFFAAAIFTAILIPLTPLHFVMKFSEAVKKRFKFQSLGRLPVGAFLVWATGETLEFAVKALQVAN